MAADLNELRAELATTEGNLAHERPHAEMERSLVALGREPGSFAGAGMRVRDLEKRAHDLGVAIGKAETDNADRERVSAYDQCVQKGRLERELKDALAQAERDEAAARSECPEGLDFQGRWKTPGGFAHLGYAGFDHQRHDITNGFKPFGPSPEVRAQIIRIEEAGSICAALRQRLTNEVVIPRQNLTLRYPALHAINLDLELEKTTA